MTDLPTIQKVKKLHDKYAKSDIACELVYTHSQIVGEIAQQINKDKNLNLNPDFIHVAALIHDMGAYKFIGADGTFNTSQYICHGITGYKILKNEKFDETFCRIAKRHTGVGITKEDIINDNLPLPLKDYIAETIEERLIMYADKFHSKNPCFNSFTWYSNYISQFGKHKVLQFQQLSNEFGIPNVEKLAEKYSIPLNQ